MKAIDFEDLIPIGVISKSIGYKMAVRIEPHDGFDATWSSLKKCLIKVHGVWAPFFIKSKTMHVDYIDVLFEDVFHEQDIRNIAHQEVFIQSSERSDHDTIEEEGELEDWISFKIIDTIAGEIGEITSIEELPGQVMAMVQYQEKIISIPLVEELILDIDLEKKAILMNLPIGILDL